MDDPALTPRQQEVFQQIYELLGEHFDGAILAIEVHDVGDNGRNIATRFAWVGGGSQAIGLADLLKTKLRRLMID